MYTVAYCDDNEIQRELVGELLEDYNSERGQPITVAGFPDAASLLQNVRAVGEFDLYILDIMMDEMDGIELAKVLREIDSKSRIIFLTASTEYAEESYDLEAFHYLVKPVNRDRLFKTLDRAIKAQEDEDAFITVRAKEADVRIRLDELLYAALSNRSVEFHLTERRAIRSTTIRTSFKEAVAEISERSDFSFCGSSAVVNLEKLTAVDNDCLRFEGGEVFFPPRSALLALKKDWKKVK